MITLLVLSTAVFTAAAVHRFDGHRVLRAMPNNEEHVNLLGKLMQTRHELDFWKEPTVPNQPVDIRLTPEDSEVIAALLTTYKVPFSTMIDDLQVLVEEEKRLNDLVRADTEAKTFTRYQDFVEIQAWMATRAQECGSMCSIQSIGKSTEGRDLNVFRISTGAGKRRLWWDAGIHAREWISPAVAMYIIDQFVSGYGSNPDITAILDNWDVEVLPLVNPDGYDFTWTTDRMWRKTRSENLGTTCRGADANRNFDFRWMTIGASSNPCSNTFAGPYAQSEPEADAEARHILSNNNYDMFITMHSYGQLFMLPYGYTTDLIPDYADLYEAGNVFADTIFDNHGTLYNVGAASQILYASSGTSRDWARGGDGAGADIKWVYTIELPESSFVLPPDRILPVCQETWHGLLAFLNHIRSQAK